MFHDFDLLRGATCIRDTHSALNLLREMAYSRHAMVFEETHPLLPTHTTPSSTSWFADARQTRYPMVAFLDLERPIYSISPYNVPLTSDPGYADTTLFLTVAINITGFVCKRKRSRLDQV